MVATKTIIITVTSSHLEKCTRMWMADKRNAIFPKMSAVDMKIISEIPYNYTDSECVLFISLCFCLFIRRFHEAFLPYQ